MKKQLNYKAHIKTGFSNQWIVSLNFCALPQSLRHLSWSPTSPEALITLTDPNWIYIRNRDKEKNPQQESKTFYEFCGGFAVFSNAQCLVQLVRAGKYYKNYFSFLSIYSHVHSNQLWHSIRTCPKYLTAAYLIGEKFPETINNNNKKNPMKYMR